MEEFFGFDYLRSNSPKLHGGMDKKVTQTNAREIENRCIVAALPHLLGEKKSLKHSPGDTFWKFVPENVECDIAKEVEATTAPRLISSGGTIDDITSINLAAEGMIVCKLKKVNILTAVITLLASFYALNAAYPKGLGGQSKNVFLFLEYILVPQIRNCQATTKLPIAVETVVSQLNRLA